MTTTPHTDVTLDASGKSFGRLATEVATLLQGKHTASYRPNTVAHIDVYVTNIDSIRLNISTDLKEYKWSTMRPGGLKTESFTERFTTNPAQTFIDTVGGMLPKNKLRKQMIKHLHVS